MDGGLERLTDVEESLEEGFFRCEATVGCEPAFLGGLDGEERGKDNARINWSFLIACQPVTPCSLAIWARRLLLQSLSASAVIRCHSNTSRATLTALARDECVSLTFI